MIFKTLSCEPKEYYELRYDIRNFWCGSGFSNINHRLALRDMHRFAIVANETQHWKHNYIYSRIVYNNFAPNST